MPNAGVRAVIHFSEPGLWAAGSLMLALLATNVGWLVDRSGRSGRQPASTILAWSGLPALGWLLRSLFLLLLPLAAWQSGALSLYFMGLTELDWIKGLAAGGPLAAIIVGLLVFGWLIYRRTLFQPSRDHDGRQGNTLPMRKSPPSPWRALLDAALWQWHWAFYRSAAIGWLAAGMGMQPGTAMPSLVQHLLEQPLYWGSWLGLGLIAGEWALNPFARAAWHIPGQREPMLRAAALAIATTALFVLTRNFWLCLGCHVVVETAIAGWFPVAPSGIMAD